MVEIGNYKGDIENHNGEIEKIIRIHLEIIRVK